jgi:RNA polymerase sigma-70 factor (family 1)
MADYTNCTEIELLMMLVTGDVEAFNEIYKRYADAMYGSAYNILRDKHTCMDLVQEVFEWFWSHKEKLEITNCKAYLITAVKFKTSNYIRNNKVPRNFFDELSDLDVTGDNEESLLEVKQLIVFIKNCSDTLPVRCREVFQLSRYDQLSNKEIAVKLGVSEKTVENQMTIALKKLKKDLVNGQFYVFFLV